MTEIGDERRQFAPHPSVSTDLLPVRPAPVDAPVWGVAGASASPSGRVSTLFRAVADATLAALAAEWERGTAFLFIPVLMAVGALAYFAADAEPSSAALAAGAVALSALAVLARRTLWLHLALLAGLLVILGMAAAKHETWRASTPMLGSEVTTVLTGRVVVIEEQDTGRTRLTMDVVETERPRLRYAPSRVRVSARAVPEGLAAGDVVSGVVRLMPPSGPVRPDGYDFSFESYFDGVGASGFFMKGPVRAADVPQSAAGQATAWIENARMTLAARIETRIGGPEGEIAAALVAGVRGGIPEEVNEALRRTGLAHVLSISGLHMALVAATIMGTLRLGFALFPGFSSRYPVRKYAAVVALVAIAIYLLISGSAVAAERSFLMLAVMLAALMVDRSALTMRNLAIAAIMVLAVSPHEVAGPSFQMSFAATAALIGAYQWWSERRSARTGPASTPARGLRRVGRLLVLYAGGLAATSIVAGLATTPYGAWHFQRVSPLSLAANLVAMPIVSVMVMPFAVAAMAMMPFDLDGPLFDVMGAGLAAMIAVAVWFSERSPVDAVGAIPVYAVGAVTVALIVATLCSTWLRLIAVPFAVTAVALVAMRDVPDIFISEDGRLVGVRTDDDIAVNRARPNAFTVENWQSSMAAGDIVKPVGGNRAADGSKREPGAFACTDGLCLTRHPTGGVIAFADTAAIAPQACGTATLLVIEDATADGLCAGDTTTVVTKRVLALAGSAEVRIVPAGDGFRAVVRHAIGEPERPWHAHRVYQRAARGLPPRQPRPVSSDGSARPAVPAP